MIYFYPNLSYGLINNNFSQFQNPADVIPDNLSDGEDELPQVCLFIFFMIISFEFLALTKIYCENKYSGLILPHW